MSKERIHKLLRKTSVLLQDDDLSALERDLAKKYLIEIYELLGEGGKKVVKGEEQHFVPKESTTKIEVPSAPRPAKQNKIMDPSTHIKDHQKDFRKLDPTPDKSFKPRVSHSENSFEEKMDPEEKMVPPVKPSIVDRTSEKPRSSVPPDFKHEMNEVVTRANLIPDKHKVLFKRDQHNELSDKLSLSPIADLRRAHGINDKLLVVNELFKGEQESYLETIDVLNAKYSFADAQSYLIRYIIDKFGWLDEERIEPARDFIKLVERRFLETQQ